MKSFMTQVYHSAILQEKNYICRIKHFFNITDLSTCISYLDLKVVNNFKGLRDRGDSWFEGVEFHRELFRCMNVKWKIL